MRTLCVVLARAGSKRLPNKNVKSFAGKSLVILACEQAMRLRGNFARAILSTNDPEAIKQGRECGIEIRERPENLCGDDVVSEDAIDDVIQWSGGGFDNTLLLEPTNPLRIDSDIMKALELAKDGRGVKSVTLIKNCIDGEVIDDKWQLEGSIHLWGVNSIRDTPYDRFNLLEVPAERSFHIDYQWQFDCAELLYKQQHGIK